MTLRFAQSWALAVALGLMASLVPRGAAAAGAADADAAAHLLEQLSQRAHGERITRSWLSLGGGVALTTAGLLDEADGDAGFGRVVWIAGLLSVTGGVLNLFVQSPLERLAHDSGRGSAGYSAGALESAWRSRARETRAARKIIAAVHFVIGGASLAASGALVAGLGGWSESRRERWAVQLFAGGTLFGSAGIAALLLPSDLEEGYDLAYGARTGARLQVQFAPARDGATLQLRAAF